MVLDLPNKQEATLPVVVKAVISTTDRRIVGRQDSDL